MHSNVFLMQWNDVNRLWSKEVVAFTVRSTSKKAKGTVGHMTEKIRPRGNLITVINETMENHISFQQDFNYRMMERPKEEFSSHLHLHSCNEELAPYLKDAITCPECCRMVFEESGDPLGNQNFRMINIRHLRNIISKDLLISKR